MATTSTAPACSHANAASTNKPEVLLPTTIKPSRYQLTIVTGLADKKFAGRVVIHLHINQPTASVTLHSLGLKFDASNSRLIAENRKSVDSKTDSKAVAAVKNSTPPAAWSSGANATGDESELQCTAVTFDEKQQTASLSFGSHPLPVGYYRLVIVYSAPLASKLAGFYMSEYKTSGSDTPHYVGVTQFEPTDARRALPCFDEPSLKATFEVTLVVPKLYEAVSNGMTVLKYETQVCAWLFDSVLWLQVLILTECVCVLQCRNTTQRAILHGRRVICCTDSLSLL